LQNKFDNKDTKRLTWNFYGWFYLSYFGWCLTASSCRASE
jgi:hypothetical protein